MLAIITIVIGVLTIIVRGTGVVAPELGRKAMKWLINRQDVMNWIAVIPFVLAALVVTGYCSQESVNWQANVALGVGILMALSGLSFLFLKKLALKIITRVCEWKALSIRLISALGVIFGVLLIWIGMNI